MKRAVPNMARHDGPRTYVMASTPVTAHTLNASKLVAGLTAQGHRVLWYAEPRFRGHVELCGAELLPSRLDAAALAAGPARPSRLGEVQRVRHFYRDLVGGMAPQHLADLNTLLAGVNVDAVLSDTLMPAAAIVAAHHDVAWATFGDGPLMWWDEDTPPFGTGLRPMSGRPGRHRNRTVQTALDRWLFGPHVDALNELRTRSGLPPAATIRDATMSSRLHLQGCTPSFEYPRAALPDAVRFVGALGPRPAVGPPVPTPLTRAERSRPLALVTQGTLRPDPSELIVPACRALIAEGFDVLVAGFDDGDWNRWPHRVTAMHRVDYPAALAEADLFVTNGGYTGVTLAVAAGVPIIQAGNSEEKPDIGARVAWSGAGASIKLSRPPARLLRRTIRRVLESPHRRAASRRLAEENEGYDAAALGPRWLGELVRATHG